MENTQQDVVCVLPHPDVQKFLLDLIEQSTFQGKMVEFVSGIKELLRTAEIKNPR